MSDSLYETKLGSINSSLEALGGNSKLARLDTNKWQKADIHDIPERHGEYDDMEQYESREELSEQSDNLKTFDKIDTKL